jgi:hypothetical protein
MGRITPHTFDIPPGIVLNEGGSAASGRYIDSHWVRFVNSKPEKIGGYVTRTTAQFLGICRGMHSWNDLTTGTQIALGTTRKLYLVANDNSLLDITPAASSASLTNAFSTVSGSAIVTVAHTAHGAVENQGVTFTGSSTVGGLVMTGGFVITAIVDADHYQFTAASNATSTAGPSGSATATYDVAPGVANPSLGYGWGSGTWGTGTWGTARPQASVTFDPYSWSLSNFGKLLLASPLQGPLYVLDPTTVPLPRATPVAPLQAPGAMRGMFTTPERFVVAYGASVDTSGAIDAMMLRWCSQGDYTTWIAASGNTAGSRRLTVGKKLMGGGALGSGVSLIWSDSALYLMQYTGSRFVFDTRLIGTNCGLFGPAAFCFARGGAFWFGAGGFQMYAGSAAKIPGSEAVSEWVFRQLRSGYEVKTLCWFNPRFNEVWWTFVPTDQAEPTIYVAVDLDNNAWIKGTLSRTGATRVDGGLDLAPILAGPDGWVYTHETGLDAAGSAINAFVKTGPLQSPEGAEETKLSGVMPDFARQSGPVSLEIASYDRLNGSAPQETATVTLQPGDSVDDLRMAGRHFAYTLRSNALGGDFRLGRMKFEMKAAGRRR